MKRQMGYPGGVAVIERTRLARRAVLLAITVLGVVALSPALAPAAIQFAPLGAISGPAPGEHFGLLNSESVAVNDFNGHVMVADSGTHVVYDFLSPADTAPTVWSGSAVPAGSIGAGSFGGGHVSVAADNESGDVYVADTKDLVIDKFDAEGKYLCQISGAGSASSSPTECDTTLAGSPAGSFSHPDTQSPLGIAVDQGTHQLYVIDSGHQVIDVFSAAGVYEKQITEVPEGLYAEGGQYTDGIAVNATTGNVFVSDSGPEKVFQFDALGVPVETRAFAGFVSVALNDASGEFFVSSTSPRSVQAFQAGGAFVGQIEGVPATGAGGLAVDQATGDIYVSDSSSVKIFAPGVVVAEVTTGQASEVQPTSATLNGTVNPEGVELTDCHFDYGTSTSYGQSVPCAETPAEIGSGSEPVEVHADLSGLAVGTTYHFRLAAANANGSRAGADQTFSTLPPPAITAETATNLTATTADLNANVNPGGQSLTQCEFQYGTNASGEHSLPCSPSLAQIGSGSSDVAISAHLSGLQENQTYRWRVIATNAAASTTTPDHTFIYTTTSEGLPDNRAYEMVTPVRKNAALLGDVFGGAEPTVAEDGSRMVLPAVQCFGEATACSVNKGGNGTPYEFSRTSAGWFTQQLAPPAQQFEVAAQALTNVNEGTALLDMPSPPNGQYDFYKRSKTGVFTDIGRVTADSSGSAYTQGPAPFALATGDFSHVVFGNREKSMWPSIDKSKAGGLYEYVGTGNLVPELIGVSGGTGSTDLLSTCGTEEASFGASTSLSVDGRVVFFAPHVENTSGSCPGTGLDAGVEVADEGVFARVDGSETVDVSVRSPVDCSGVCLGSTPAGALFQGASLDGTRVFFTSTQQLTNEASEDTVHGTRKVPVCRDIAEANGCNLYVASLVVGGGGQVGRVAGVRALSGGALGGGGPRVQGVMAVSSDGLRVYFVARGVLSAAANDQGALPRDGAENLYLSEGGGPVRFIATLAETQSDIEQWRASRANLTLGGRFLLFTSQAPLTRDDTRAVGGAAQVFRYDAVTGSLVRVSIGESGFNDDGNAGRGDASLASVVFAQQFTAGGAGRTGPSLSADGSRVFFMSPVGLTRGALNDVQIGVNRVDASMPAYAQNVYEYHDGHVSLISDGRDANVEPQTACNAEEISAVCLIAVDSSGANVFFSSADRLVSSDTDTQVDVYDARICSSGDPCVPEAAPSPAPCDGEACHGIPPARASGAPGPTATFNGAGNLSSVSPPGPAAKPLTRAQKLAHALRACHRMHARHRRRVCEAQARHRYGPLHARKAVHKRGGR
jgi:hypothetical protein